MKQELRAPHADRTRVVSRVKDSPRTGTDNGTSPGSKARPKSTSLDASTTNLARRSPQFNKLRPATNGLGGPKVVEQFARLRRREDASRKGSVDGVHGKIKELESRLGESEKLVRELQEELTGLKIEIEKLQVRNAELESQNKKLEQDLAAAEANIKMMEKTDQKNSKNPAEMEVRDNPICKSQSLARRTANQVLELQQNIVIKMPIPTLSPSKGSSHGPPPPPPPPPLPHNASGRATVSKASALAQLYHSLTKQDRKQGSASNGSSASPISGFAHRGIVGELQHRSAHLLAIKADVETKGQLIKHLIQKVQWSPFTSMEDVLTFVDWLDGELSTLVDERAVLKHFDWPEKRADALREAAVEFRGLKQLEAHVHSLKDDSSLSCEVTLKKISNLLDKLERGVDRLIKLRNANMILYKECKIPTDWMLDSGMVNKMKQSSVKLARLYLSRVAMELEVLQHSERQSAQEALLLQGVKFAYRTHQFAGGLDSELTITIEDLKKRVESQSRGSQ